MKIEQSINSILQNLPYLKKIIKRIYQIIMYCISPKFKKKGNIECLSPNNNKEYFFGYYDKTPWDKDNRFVLCLECENTWKNVAPNKKANIIIIDTKNNNKVTKIAETSTWNVQQGCMLQWLGPDFKNKIIYNDYRNEKYCSVILDLETMHERVMALPVYTVSLDGKFALSLDFSRLHRLRPGYGYSNIEEITKNEKVPNSPCIWSLNLETNEVASVLKYTDLLAFETRNEMLGAEHKVNHLMLSPDGKRFMFLHRWIKGSKKYSRLITCDIDGKNLYNLSDDDMVSHCNWKNNEEIIAYENKKDTGNGYYLMKDKTNVYSHLWPSLIEDGHPSYSPDRTYVITDTYPNRSRIASIKILKGDKIKIIAQVFAPFKYDNDTRCDLHPRCNRDGSAICFDAVFEGHRGLYKININDLDI